LGEFIEGDLNQHCIKHDLVNPELFLQFDSWPSRTGYIRLSLFRAFVAACFSVMMCLELFPADDARFFSQASKAIQFV
jgi:hypothetical protein